MTQLGFDNCTRADQTGFGLASDGVNTWSSADFGTATTNVKTNQLEFTTNANSTGCHLGSTKSADGHIFGTASISNVTAGQAFIILRQTASQTYYRAKLIGTALTIDRVNAGTSTQLGTAAFTATNNTKYNMPFEITGGDSP